MDDRGPLDLERRIDDLKKRVDHYESLDKQELIDNLTMVKAQLLTAEKEVDRLHDQFVVVPEDKAGNNIVFVRMAQYINCILEELRSVNPIFTHNSFFMEEIL